MGKRTLFTTSIDSPIGVLTLVAADEALVLLGFGPADTRLNATAIRGLCSDDGGLKSLPRPQAAGHPILNQTVRELDEYFAGERRMFEVPLEMPVQAFGRLAWAALSTIPFGPTRSYGQQAVAIGRPTAVRAVARANGANRIAIILPCHRVIGANGSLVGFGGGLAAKQWLLDHEKAVLASR